jgi:Tol biopolymer transport system component
VIMKHIRLSRISSFSRILLFGILLTSCSVQSNIYNPTETISGSASEEHTTNPIFKTTSLPTKTLTYHPLTITVTPRITTTSEPIISETATIPLMVNRYLVMNDYNQYLYLVDSITGEYRNLESKETHPKRLISFVSDGCNLIVQLDDKSIDQIDLKAKVIEKILPADWYQGSGWVFGETLPVSLEWIAYNLGHGRQGYDSWEFEDVETMRLSDQAVFRLSEHGGAGTVEWSPDGSRITFNDFDENKIRQLYVSQADGSNKTQLTNFSEENIDMYIIKWSPDGKKIAFDMSSTLNGKSNLVVILFNGENQVITYPSIPLNVKNLWWNDNNILVIHSSNDDQSQEPSHGKIIWLNTQSGVIISRLNGEETPDKYIISADYFDQSTAGFFSDFNFFTYDYQTKTINDLFKNQFNYSDWSLAPLGFPGERNCIIP